jgi:hypothetical protein
VAAVFLVALALAGPPRATLNGARLTVSAWCWANKCGAPVATAPPAVRVSRGSMVRVDFRFAPSDVTATVGGARIQVGVRGTEATWTARSGGGVTIRARAAQGFVVYVGRLAVR